MSYNFLQDLNTSTVLVERNVANQADIKSLIKDLQDQTQDDNVKKWLKGNVRNWLVNEYEGVQQLTANDLPADAPDWMARGVESPEGIFNIQITDKLKNDLNEIVQQLNQQVVQTGSLSRMTVPQVQQAIVKANEEKEDEISTEEEGTEVIHTFEDGWTWRHVVGRAALNREGSMMNHCVGDSDNYMRSDIYSLRNEKNRAKVTIELRSGDVRQIKGNSNAVPSDPAIIEKVFVIINKVKMRPAGNGDFKRMIADMPYIKNGDGTVLIASAMTGNIDRSVDFDVSNDDGNDHANTRSQYTTHGTFTTKHGVYTVGTGDTLQITGELNIHETLGNHAKKTQFGCNTLIVHRDCNLVDVVVALPNAVAIGGNANWQRCHITHAPEHLRVEGDLILPRSMKDFPKQIKVKGTIHVPKRLKELVAQSIPEDATVSYY